MQILFTLEIRLQLGTDFSDFKRLTNSIQDMEHVHPAFDSDEHLDKNLVNFRFYGHDLDISRSETFLTSLAANITGRITCHGELWLKRVF